MESYNAEYQRASGVRQVWSAYTLGHEVSNYDLTDALGCRQRYLDVPRFVHHYLGYSVGLPPDSPDSAARTIVTTPTTEKPKTYPSSSIFSTMSEVYRLSARLLKLTPKLGKGGRYTIDQADCCFVKVHCGAALPLGFSCSSGTFRHR